jgi:nucleoside-diphosphate-sugar epimerase
MRVLVTGATGRVGRYVVEEFRKSGHEVFSFDRQQTDFALSLQGDLTCPGEAYAAVAASKPGVVVHMAAWSDSGIVSDCRTYGENACSTFNLLQACGDAGVRRIIVASSAQVYGFSRLGPLFAPADETHPLRPLNSYAASKVANELSAEYFARVYGLSVLSFRIMGARTALELPGEIATLGAAPERGKDLLWTRIDARDVAIACRQALETHGVPSGAYNITGARIVLDIPTKELMQRYWPGAQLRSDLAGSSSPLSCAKAQAAFGFSPQFVWSQQHDHPET